MALSEWSMLSFWVDTVGVPNRFFDGILFGVSQAETYHTSLWL